MGCKECDKPKCNGKCGCKSPKVLQINNPAEYITFHKVSIPAAMGDSTTNPPRIGAYRNALVYYEADHTSWMYSTDGIPTLVTGEQGPTGPQGPAGTITIGTTTTGEAGEDASVENVGTPENAILNFTIPKGDKGDQGIQGETGPQGYMNEQDVRDVVDTIVPEGFFDNEATDSDCGEGFKLEKLLGGKPISLEISGDSRQDNYVGKNLWEYSTENWVYTTSSANMSYTINDGTLEITTTVAGTYKNVAFRLDLPSGTYTFSLGKVVNSNSSMTVKRMTLATRNTDLSGRTAVQHIDMGSPKTITLNNVEGKIYTLEFWVTYATALTNTATFSNVQIEAGSTATSYEPFVGSHPSPSPDYPVAVQSVTGEQVITIGSRNLFKPVPFSTYPQQGITTTISENGTISINGTSTTSYSNLTIASPIVGVVANKTYTFSIDRALSFRLGMRIYHNAERTDYTDKVIQTGETSITFSFAKPSVSAYLFIGTGGTGISFDATFAVQLEFGNVANPYVPYEITQYPINLRNISLSRLDESSRDKIYNSGTSWILRKEVASDTHDFAVSAILGSTADPSIASGDGAFLIHKDNVTDYDNTLGKAVLSDNLGFYTSSEIASNVEAASMPDGSFVQRSGTNDRVYFRNTGYIGKTGAEVRAIMLAKSGGTNYWYPLAAAVETEITDSSLIAELNAIEMRTGINTIAISSHPNGLSAELCLEAYLDNWNGNIESIDERVDSLESSDLQNDILGFHSVAGSSATYILQFPNGKNMIVDSGQVGQWSTIKTAIDSLGITKFDYAITTHFHSDHYGNNINLINTYDFSDCQWYIQSKPDYANHSDQIADPETSYDNCVNDLTSHGIIPIVPDNFSTITVDEDRNIVIKFFNTDPDIIENYYTRYTEYRDYQKINFNDFSVMAEVTYGNNRILLTGDIERPVEDAYHQYMQKVTVMTAPHHAVNTDANKQFYYAVSPEATICSYVTTSPTWIQNYYKGFKYIKETSKLIVTAYDSKPDDGGMFSFDVTGNSWKSYVKDGGIDYDSPFYTDDNYVNINALIDATIDNKAAITLKEVVNRLPMGAEADIPWYSGLNEKFVQIRSDISDIFPISASATDFTMHIARSYNYIVFELQPSYARNDVRYELRCSTSIWNTHNISSLKYRLYGYGRIDNQVNEESGLITLLSSLPTGNYFFWYRDQHSSVLNANGAYEVRADVVHESDVRTTAMLSGSLRDSANVHSDACIMGFFDSEKTNKVRWYNVTA